MSIYVVYVSIKLVLLWLLLLMGAMWPIGLLDGFCLHPNINVMTYSKETLKLCEQKKKKKINIHHDVIMHVRCKRYEIYEYNDKSKY